MRGTTPWRLGAGFLLALLTAACPPSNVASERGVDRCAGVSCLASDSCHQVGVCDASTGLCSNPATVCPSGQQCDLSDGQCQYTCFGVTCSASDLCHAAGYCSASTGQCTPEAPKSCAAGQACDPADGVCKTGCANVICTASDLCHVPGTCNPATGTCSAETPTSCPAGEGCDLTDGQCKNLCASVTCTASDLCHIAGSCDPTTGQCSPETPVTCPAGESCDPANGVCENLCALVTCPPGEVCDPTTGTCRIAFTIPSPQVAKNLGPIGPRIGIAMDTVGSAYLTSSIFSLTPLSFDGHLVASTGNADVLVLKYDTTGTNVWAVGFGDSAGLAQQGTGVAVTSDATAAIFGTFAGSFTIGTPISSANSIDFLAALNGGNGTGVWAKQFNDGNGGLLAIAASPSSSTNRIAVCGKTTIAATDLVPGAVLQGTTDLVIGVFTSAGTLVWAAEVGTANSNAECDALAVDDNGDVYAAGQFDSASLTFPGAPAITLTGSGNVNARYMWVAKFAGAGVAGGASTVAAVAFVGNSSLEEPLGLSADAAGKVAIAGQFSGTLTLGSTALVALGTDAFIARLDPTANFAPLWALRFGGPSSDGASGVAVNSLGEVVVTGQFSGTTTGAAVLTSTGAKPDAYLLKLDATTGATQFAAGYGDSLTQQGSGVVVNRFGTGLADLALVGTNFGTITFPPPANSVTANPVGKSNLFLMVGQLQ